LYPPSSGLVPPVPPSQRCGLCQNFKQTTLTTRLYKVRTNLYTYENVPTRLGPTVRFIRYPGSCRPWRFCSTCPVGPICCVRHGRPRHSAAEVTDKLRHWRCCPQVVPVVPDQPYPVCPSWHGPIDHCSADMWCSTGLSDWASFVHRVYS